MSQQKIISLGALFAALATIIGAFGAHYLKSIFTPEQLLSFETGVRYQFYHAFAILICGILASHYDVKKLVRTAIIFAIGIVLFSGSIYALMLLKSQGVIGLKGIGILTPVGGLFFISGWIMLIANMLQHNIAKK
jgi:uncharacterized membrane protein YgdD (TMEM256/DUF423 family)